ncbi:MAG: hypothetical protein M0R74_11445, partial [Dehalococcoidia bacterium]|nr:hypothetical protein [Dehalococcoidia bacterium]
EGTGGTALRPVELVERGALRRVSGRAVVANLPEHICERMASRARALLSDLGVPVEIQPLHVQATGAGAGIFLVSEYEQVRAGFGSLGKRGRPAEQVAEDAIAALREHDRSGAAVDVYLADQALLPLALADAPSQFTTPTVSGHLGTNAWVIEQFGVAAVEFDRPGQGRTLVTVRPMPIERRYTATPPHLDGTSNA